MLLLAVLPAALLFYNVVSVGTDTGYEFVLYAAICHMYIAICVGAVLSHRVSTNWGYNEDGTKHVLRVACILICLGIVLGPLDDWTSRPNFLFS